MIYEIAYKITSNLEKNDVIKKMMKMYMFMDWKYLFQQL